MIDADIPANNGVIHAINQLLLPPFVSSNVIDAVTAASDTTKFVELLVENGLFSTLSGDGPFTVLAPVDLAFDKVPIQRF